jgi:hypothetical protein
MSQVIIYNQDNGIPAVMVPTQEMLNLYGIMAVAIKDVPAGRPFKIVGAADLPDARQETWVVDNADLTDGFGGESNEFPAPEVIEEDQVEVQDAD